MITLTLGKAVKIIGGSAFSGCEGLTNVVIPDGTTTLSEYAFSACTNLTTVTIPSSVTKIDYEAFSVCGKLTTINYAGTTEQWLAIPKGYAWTVANVNIVCTNGTLISNDEL